MRVALDLYCGGGGVALGLLAAGFDRVIGFDLDERCARVYPGEFHLWDLSTGQMPDWVDMSKVALAWASPPCQLWSRATWASRAAGFFVSHPNLLPATRRILARVRSNGGAMTVIENVPEAPVRADLTLTGDMMGLPRIHRQRLFEIEGGVPPQPAPSRPLGRRKAWETLTVRRGGSYFGRQYRQRKAAGLKVHVSKAEAAEAMGIDLDAAPMSWAMLGESVPPPYAEYIGRWALRGEMQPNVQMRLGGGNV